MRITSSATTTFVALAIVATVGSMQPAIAAPNPNSTTRGNSEASQANAELKKEQNNGKKPGKSLEAQQNACMRVRASIANRTANLQSAGERHLAVIDKVYANLANFNGKEGLELSEVDQSRVASARAQAEQTIFTLGQNEDNLNCEDKNVGQMAATVRLSVQSVNAALKEYREAVGNAITHTRQQVNQEGKA
jgi:hypothetical protein